MTQEKKLKFLTTHDCLNCKHLYYNYKKLDPEKLIQDFTCREEFISMLSDDEPCLSNSQIWSKFEADKWIINRAMKLWLIT